MEPAPLTPEPIRYSEVVSEVLMLASQLGLTAAELDPDGINTYQAHPPDTVVCSVFGEKLASVAMWLHLEAAAEWITRHASYPLPREYTPVWYVMTHRMIKNLHYYVDAAGTLYASHLQDPINGEVAAFRLTPELVSIMNDDDIQHLMLELRHQRRMQQGR